MKIRAFNEKAPKSLEENKAGMLREFRNVMLSTRYPADKYDIACWWGREDEEMPQVQHGSEIRGTWQDVMIWKPKGDQSQPIWGRLICVATPKGSDIRIGAPQEKLVSLDHGALRTAQVKKNTAKALLKKLAAELRKQPKSEA